jgi:hypothetical protein
MVRGKFTASNMKWLFKRNIFDKFWLDNPPVTISKKPSLIAHDSHFYGNVRIGFDHCFPTTGSIAACHAAR